MGKSEMVILIHDGYEAYAFPGDAADLAIIEWEVALHERLGYLAMYSTPRRRRVWLEVITNWES